MTKEEVLKFGLEVFNGEQEKFERWLNKFNMYLQDSPKNKIETDLNKVKEILNRIEYSNFN